jgi:hypothetical protein
LNTIIIYGNLANASHGKNPSMQFLGNIMLAKIGQNALKKRPIFNNIVNLSNILWYPIGKVVNFELAPKKENV